MDTGGEFDACSAGDDCACLPPTLASCVDTDSCITGEVCVDLDPPVCLSAESFRDFISGAEIIPPRGGFTGDDCSVTDDCRGTRFCANFDSGCPDICSQDVSCFCLPEDGLTTCENDTQCELGETCAAIDEDNGSICVSISIAPNTSNDTQSTSAPSTTVEIVDTTTSPFVTLEPSPAPPFNSGNCCNNGFTGDTCTSDMDCRGARDCLDSAGSGSPNGCPPSEFCICVPRTFTFCADSSDCESGELCTSVDATADTFCVSEELVENADELEEVGSQGSNPPNPESPSVNTDCCNDGFTFDRCTSSADCRGDRDCLEDGMELPISCTGNSFSCVCLPPGPLLCLDSSVCEAGEVCSSVPGTVVTVCVSKDVVENLDGFEQVGPVRSPMPPTPMETPFMVPSDPVECCNDGFTLDTCATSANCRGDRNCLQGEERTPCTLDSEFCVCMPPEFVSCTASMDCEAGEVCSLEPGGTPVCISEEVVESMVGFDEVGPVSLGAPTDDPLPTGELADDPSVTSMPTEDPPTNDVASAICIDAEALSHLPREGLVFKEHAIGRVLCDGAGSCATGGHIVVFGGQAMMMRTYCELVKCERRDMYVNSPRYRRGTRVKSRTEGLEYTAFAARWETRMEERVLAAAVRAWL